MLPVFISDIVAKLRKKYALLKSTWRTLHDRIKSDSGEAAMQYPAWYHVINPVFSGTHAEVELSESSSDMSFRITPLNDESECESESESDVELHENTEGIEEFERTENQQGKENVTVGKLKTVPPPHKKRKVIRSNVQALSSLASGLKEVAESQMKRDKLTLQHEKERDDNYLKFREEEARKTR